MGDLDYLQICSLQDIELQTLIMKLNPTLTKASIKKRFHSYYKNKRIISKMELVKFPIELLNHGEINPHFDENLKCHIIFEDENWIAINKGTGVHSHPLDYSCDQNALSFLTSKQRYTSLNVNSSKYDRGLLYRLDQETSGILILAKSDALYEEVRSQFTQVVKEKIYLAKVCGDARSIIGEHHHLMEASLKSGKKMTGANEAGFEARLKVLDCKYNHDQNKSILRISLHTGVRHQIRFQLSSLGFPIIGDQLYGTDNADRLYLHALEYKIKTVDYEICLNTDYPEGF